MMFVVRVRDDVGEMLGGGELTTHAFAEIAPKERSAVPRRRTESVSFMVMVG